MGLAQGFSDRGEMMTYPTWVTAALGMLGVLRDIYPDLHDLTRVIHARRDGLISEAEETNIRIASMYVQKLEEQKRRGPWGLGV